MEPAWARALLATATTLAAASTQPEPSAGSCYFQHDGLREMCARQDYSVYPVHVLCPLAVPCAVQAFASMPTFLLSSTRRARRLCAASAAMVALWCAVVGSAAVYAWSSPSLAYALSLHVSALFLLRLDGGGLLVSEPAVAAAKYAALALLITGAVYAGPPLPVLGAPGLSGCCGAVVHLLSWAASETLGALLLTCVAALGAY
jgi:hypothetical protein